MATTLAARPNYYELLGLRAEASQDDIFAAFSKAMGMFATRPTARIAQLSVAFETLRNPAKRRAYDEAQGLNRKPEPAAPIPPQPVGAAFIGSASHEAAVQALRDKLARLAAPAEQPPQPKAPAEERISSFIASSVRGASEPWPAPVADSAPVRPKLEREVRRTEPQPALETPVIDERSADESPLHWKRPALIAGGLVGAAGLIGALAGVSVQDHPAPGTAKADVTIPLPTARPAAETVPAGAPETINWTQRRAATRPVARQAKPRLQPAPAPPAAVADAAPTEPPPLESTIAEAAPTESASVQPTSASLPLPKAVIARTIHRIGYSCGSVTSASAVEGSSGVYKVTCSSGQSYQASPLRGRYHFRRLKS